MERHPNATWYEQCVTYNAFPSKLHELAYLYFGMFMMYWLPLIVILFCYASIIIEIYRRSRESICGQGESTRKQTVCTITTCVGVTTPGWRGQMLSLKTDFGESFERYRIRLLRLKMYCYMSGSIFHFFHSRHVYGIVTDVSVYKFYFSKLEREYCWKFFRMVLSI